MITRLNVASIYVLDKDEALDFYVNKLGLEKGNDVRQGAYRWLTVRVPGDGGTEISLEQPGPPLHDEATAAQLRELITKGALGGLVFVADDVRRCTRRSGTAASPISPRSPPTTSTARTWASATRSATRSGYCSRGRSRRPLGLTHPGQPEARTERTRGNDRREGPDQAHRLGCLPQDMDRRRASRHAGGRPRAQGGPRAELGRGARRRASATCRRSIAGMPEQDRALAERIHELVLAAVPDLVPKTYYGMPAYAEGRQGHLLLQARLQVQGALRDVRIPG